MYIVYEHKNILTNKIYIGYTSKSLIVRWKEHCRSARFGSNTHFHRAIRKHGITCWNHTILIKTKNAETAKKHEIRLINKTNALTEGYNMTHGGEGANGRIHTDESKEKMRQTQLLFKHTKECKIHMKEHFTQLRGTPVHQYDGNGKYIATFNSARSAAEHVGLKYSNTISQICKGTINPKFNQTKAAGYYWRYASEYPAADLSFICQ